VIRIHNTLRKVLLLKVQRTNKQIFLKVIWKHLFFGFNGRYSKYNTKIVDDSPPKHLLNSIEIVILPKTWTFVDVVQANTYVMDTLLSWIIQLHMN
jgi:hypothetical protein